LSILRIETPKVFKPLLVPSRYKEAYGGRGSGKSHFFGELTIEDHIRHPGYRTVCIREVQKSLRESIKRLLEDKIISLGVGKNFNVLNDRIETPGSGVIVFQGMQDHTAESIKSLEGYDVALVEEAQTLSERSLELLRPTIRKPGSELRFGWNPGQATDPVDKLLRGVDLPPDAIVVKTSYKDNPFFPEELEAERLFDKRNNPDRYGHIWEGEYQPLVTGAVWDTPLKEILVDPFQIPAYWPKCYALDPGWNRTAVLWAAHDRDTDTAYLYSEHYRAQAEPPIHVAAIKARGEWIPGVIDPGASGSSQRDGKALLTEYRSLGLNLELANNAVEAGINAVWTRLSIGRLKVFKTLQNWQSEYQRYHRDENGKIIKLDDHLMDDTRYIVLPARETKDRMSGLERAIVMPPKFGAGQPSAAGGDSTVGY